MILFTSIFLKLLEGFFPTFVPAIIIEYRAKRVSIIETKISPRGSLTCSQHAFIDNALKEEKSRS